MQYLSAVELEITEPERLALIEVTEFLRTSAPKHINKTICSQINSDTRSQLGFNMGTAIVKLERGYDCGCVACLGGYVSLIMQGVTRVLTGKRVTLTKENMDAADLYVGKGHSSALHGLYYPYQGLGGVASYGGISPQSAGSAGLYFLTTGKINWEKALTENDQEDLIVKQ